MATQNDTSSVFQRLERLRSQAGSILAETKQVRSSIDCSAPDSKDLQIQLQQAEQDLEEVIEFMTPEPEYYDGVVLKSAADAVAAGSLKRIVHQLYLARCATSVVAVALDSGGQTDLELQGAVTLRQACDILDEVHAELGTFAINLGDGGVSAPTAGKLAPPPNGKVSHD